MAFADVDLYSKVSQQRFSFQRTLVLGEVEETEVKKHKGTGAAGSPDGITCADARTLKYRYEAEMGKSSHFDLT